MHFRRRSLRPEATDDEMPDHAAGDTESFRAMSILNRIALQRAAFQLPPGYRTTFILFHLYGHDHNEIALMLGHSEGTSKSQLFKARRKLRGLLHAPRTVPNLPLLDMKLDGRFVAATA